MIRVVGLDLSLNHAAMVCLTDGDLHDYAFITDRAGDAKTDSARGIRLNVGKMSERLNKDKHRLLAWRVDRVSSWVYLQLMRWSPDYVGIEDYALRAEQGAHQMGEVGGVVRHMLFTNGIPFRLHDPTTLKMFVAHDGTCQKDEVERSVEERWGVDFKRHNSAKAEQTSQDIADAYGLAQMVWTEVLIRAGKIKVSSLHVKEIRVFNRITKYQPCALVDREWIGGV
jgi:Holliday junction resolvasome RuvABC endonuclease subunit